MICDAKKICALISRAQKIAIVCHANPDGDTLGSGLALFRTLRALCKDVSIFCSDAPAGKLTALNGAELVRTDVPKEAFDLAVAVDCSDINLLFRHANLVRHARTSACVDHHVSNNDYADFTYVERGVAAAAQPIYKLIAGAEVGHANRRTALYCLGDGQRRLCLFFRDGRNHAHCRRSARRGRARR